MRCSHDPRSPATSGARIIAQARKLSGPSFAAWLQVAAFTGLRPGELDALRWERVEFDRSRIVVAEQFNAATRKFDTPKNHQRRDAPLTAHAHSALTTLAREGVFCFVSLRGEHWTPSSRAYHWKAIRAAAGWDGSLYLATRHFAGWYMVNELEMSSEDLAIALGHQDGGNLVRRRYGHRDKHRALDRIVGAYATRAIENRPKSSGSSTLAPPQQRLFQGLFMSDNNARVSTMSVRFARSATKHRISKESIRHVVAHYAVSFEEPAGTADVLDPRLICLGDDASGRALEVIGVEGPKGELIVIHAMALRNKYRQQYEEAKRWRL